MSAYLALLRGINVGPNQRIAMADLRKLLEGLSYSSVSTYLQSGNALFSTDQTDSDALAKQIEAAITAELGLTVRALVRERADLARVVAANPFEGIATDPKRLQVTFLSETPDAAVFEAIDPAAYAPDQLAVGEREIYAWYPDGVRKTKLNPPFFEKRMGKDAVATARNWNTITKLLEVMS
jgi:uncharacterized protein (DUF1697 family)